MFLVSLFASWSFRVVSAMENTVRIRTVEGEERRVALAEVGGRHFEDAVPWREFRWYRGQRHLPGSYWSARMGAPVGYESRLELMVLMLADFDPQVRGILSQPFLLEGQDAARTRRHVPDYLLRLADGTVRVVDVKPAARLSDVRVRESLGWTRRLLDPVGWEYEVCSEPRPALMANVRFLAGFRREEQFPPDEADQVRRTVSEPTPFADVVAGAAGVVGGSGRARAVVLHLLWCQVFRTDLSQPLSGASVVVAA